MQSRSHRPQAGDVGAPRHAPRGVGKGRPARSPAHRARPQPGRWAAGGSRESLNAPAFRSPPTGCQNRGGIAPAPWAARGHRSRVKRSADRRRQPESATRPAGQSEYDARAQRGAPAVGSTGFVQKPEPPARRPVWRKGGGAPAARAASPPLFAPPGEHAIERRSGAIRVIDTTDR